jgi:cystathionine gamma-synthase
MMVSAESALLHAGESRALGAPATPPLIPSSIFVSWGEPDAGSVYGRNGNPTWEALEQALGAIEHAEAAVFASGQAASMALMLALTERRRVLLPNDGYYNTRGLAARLSRLGAKPVLTDQVDLAAVEKELNGPPVVLWAETPTNPLLRVADLAALGRLAAVADAPMVVDNTVATGLLQRPLDYGALASVYSLTKAISGHSDVVLGAVVTRDHGLLEQLRDWRRLGGGIPGPFETWLALRGLKTLPLRIHRQSENALSIAEYLTGHPRVRAVHYPGTTADTRATAVAQMFHGFGPLLSFEVDGTAADADAVVMASKLITPATSFGGTGSTWERRARWTSESAPESLIRLSAGIEATADLVADIRQSLEAAR